MSKATERPEPANWPIVLALLFGGALVALFLAYKEARAGEVSVPRAIGRALKTGIRWFFSFL